MDAETVESRDSLPSSLPAASARNSIRTRLQTPFNNLTGTTSRSPATTNSPLGLTSSNLAPLNTSPGPRRDPAAPAHRHARTGAAAPDTRAGASAAPQHTLLHAVPAQDTLAAPATPCAAGTAAVPAPVMASSTFRGFLGFQSGISTYPCPQRGSTTREGRRGSRPTAGGGC